MAKATTSKQRSQEQRWRRKLAETNQALAGLPDGDSPERKRLSRHRLGYANSLGITLDEASAVLS